MTDVIPPIREKRFMSGNRVKPKSNLISYILDGFHHFYTFDCRFFLLPSPTLFPMGGICSSPTSIVILLHLVTQKKGNWKGVQIDSLMISAVVLLFPLVGSNYSLSCASARKQYFFSKDLTMRRVANSEWVLIELIGSRKFPWKLRIKVIRERMTCPIKWPRFAPALIHRIFCLSTSSFSLIILIIILYTGETPTPMPIIRGFPAFTTLHAILAFMVSMLLGFVEVKYQGKPTSPFDTRPLATSLVVFCLVFYCSLALVAHLGLAPARCARALPILMMLAASLSVASLASLLLPGRFHSFPYFLLFALLSGVLLRRLARHLYMWVQNRIVTMFVPAFRSRQLHSGRAPPLLPHTVMDAHFVPELGIDPCWHSHRCPTGCQWLAHPRKRNTSGEKTRQRCVR